MNITPHLNPSPIATVVNPPTDSLRRENIQQPVIAAPTHASGSPAEKGAADKDKASAQSNEQFDFTELQKSAEKKANSINGGSEQSSSGQGNKEGTDQHSEQSASAQNSGHETEINGKKGDSVDLDSAETAQHAQEIQQLKQRDQEVRTHEQAHAAMGGGSTGAPSYEFKVGPDGKKYAVNGEVSVDVSPVKGDPTATIAKMEKVHAAALAPANPSGQDRRVAAQAIQLSSQAQVDLLALQKEESVQTKEETPRIDSGDVSNDASSNKESSEALSKSFDQQMNSTLKAQEEVMPSMPSEIKERSQRVEGYYSGITQAYEKSPSHQFQLIA